MRAKFCTHTVLAVVSTLILGVSEVTLAQTTTAPTTKTTTKKSTKKATKKEEKKATSEVVAPTPVTPTAAAAPAPAPAPATTEAKKEESAPESLHKISTSIYAEYYAEPLAKDPNSAELEKQYKKQRGLLIPAFRYTYNKQWVLSLSPEFRYNNGHQIGGYPTNPGRLQLARGLIYLGKKGVLNEKDHGIDLEVGYVRRLFNRAVVDSDGNHRFRTILNKNVNEKFNFNILNDFMYNATRKWTDDSWKFLDNFIPTLNFIFSDKLTLTILADNNISYYHRKIPGLNRLDYTVEMQNILTYTINDTFSAGPNLKYYYSINKNGVSNYNSQNKPTPTTIFAPYVSMNISPKTSITMDASWILTKYNDDQDGLKLAKNFSQYPDLGLYFSHAF